MALQALGGLFNAGELEHGFPLKCRRVSRLPLCAVGLVGPGSNASLKESGKNAARATLGAGLAVSAFPRYVPV
jgi:hypothetical protein